MPEEDAMQMIGMMGNQAGFDGFETCVSIYIY
jgi:hypothetical protein